jgi:hypothetical protein
LREALAVADSDEAFLDVVATNQVALQWYTKLRFVPTDETTWLEIPLPSDGDGGVYRLLGYPQAAACQTEFGFSEFHIRTGSGTYRIGMLGDEWFRVPAEAATETHLHRALRALDSRRRMLSRIRNVPGTDRGNPLGRELVRTRRMVGNLLLVKGALGAG